MFLLIELHINFFFSEQTKFITLFISHIVTEKYIPKVDYSFFTLHSSAKTNRQVTSVLLLNIFVFCNLGIYLSRPSKFNFTS